MPVIKSLRVDKFRNLPVGEYPLGKRLTVITGQNATGKSTLLGMIAQPFGINEKDIWGRTLRSKFSEIFKMSPTYDIPGDHTYYINTYTPMHSDGTEVQVKTYKRNDIIPPIRFVTGRNRAAGDGNIDIPVVYLGLKRVFPLGETAECSITETNLTVQEKEFFVENHVKILSEISAVIKPQVIQSKNPKEKETFGIETDTYDSYVISAGQDNIGKILGAVISIIRYKEQMQEKYRGAFLLIDEADVTLHSASQRKLVDFLLRMARIHDIQIIVTTHSIEFIKAAYDSIDDRQNVCVWHLYAPYGDVIFSCNPRLDDIMSALTLQNENQQLPKIKVFTEDDEGVLFLKKLLSAEITHRIEIIAVHCGYTMLRNVSKAFDKFIPAIWVMDGDQHCTSRDSKALLAMPGGSSVEHCMCSLLSNLPANDSFWKIAGTNYTKQHFISNRPQLYADRTTMKNWFNAEKKNWGRGMSAIYKRWYQEHEEDVLKFNKEFIKAFNMTAEKMALPKIEERE